ncbi:Sodium hydrogen exchanger 9, partial [Brachionus plicatilis]
KNQINQIIREEETKRETHEHIVDSVDLFLFLSLLILVILTIWFLKHKKFKYVHETGLAIFYGSIFGALIRYVFKDNQKRSIFFTPANLTLNSIDDLPEYVYMSIPNLTQNFVYKFKEPSSDTSSMVSRDFEEKVTFNPETFFNILLPPIIFQAGYSMKRKQFFKNFGAILMFALIGTTISSFVIGGLMYWVVSWQKSLGYMKFLDCLLFGSIVSATDPVTTLSIFSDQNLDLSLYSLIFGESVLNDAVSLILVQQIEKFSGNSLEAGQFFRAIGSFFVIFLGSILVGSLVGCTNAILTKFTKIKHHPSLETALFILISYSAFYASEAIGLSGIVTMLIAGIFQAHYTFNNLSVDSKFQTRQIFHLISFLSENFIFIYIGISMFTFRNHQWEAGFILPSLIVILFGRAVNIYPLSYLINLTRSSSNKIKLKNQNLMFFSGLRGALAFGLAIRNTSTSSRQLILTTTSVIVIITVVFFGGMTKKVIELLNIESADSTADKVDKDKNQKIKGKFKAFLSKLVIFKLLRSLDKKFVKPFLTNSRPTLIDNLPNKLLPIARLLTTIEQIEENDGFNEENFLINDSRGQFENISIN